jgi:ABC-type transport system involved in multi-copper enzyme maturation permease subunit
MIWLTWRQSRAQTLVAAGALAVLAVTFAITGPQLVHLYDTTVATCHSHHDCALALHAFASQDSLLQNLNIFVMQVVPGLIGVFWGAPLIARELETGTHRLALTQSVSRGRWLAVKLGMTGLASMAAAGLLSLMVTWWSSPLDRISNNLLDPGVFGQRGIAPVGYAAFAFALGVTAGLLIRRTVPAMAVTIAAFAGVQAAFGLWLRAHLIAPLRAVSALNLRWATSLGVMTPGNHLLVGVTPQMPGAWIYSSQVTTASGSTNLGTAPQSCSQSTMQACTAAISRMHLRQIVTYQPGSRYWTFQWYETAIYLALALALAGFCFLWARRRLS